MTFLTKFIFLMAGSILCLGNPIAPTTRDVALSALTSSMSTSATTIGGPQTIYSTLTVHHSCKSHKQSSQAGNAKPESTPSGILDYVNSALVTLDVTSVTAAGTGHASHSTRSTHSSHKACSSRKSHSIHSTHNSHSAHTTHHQHTVSSTQMIHATRSIIYHPSLQSHASSSTTTASDDVVSGFQSPFGSSTSLHSSSSPPESKTTISPILLPSGYLSAQTTASHQTATTTAQPAISSSEVTTHLKSTVHITSFITVSPVATVRPVHPIARAVSGSSSSKERFKDILRAATAVTFAALAAGLAGAI